MELTYLSPRPSYSIQFLEISAVDHVEGSVGQVAYVETALLRVGGKRRRDRRAVRVALRRYVDFSDETTDAFFGVRVGARSSDFVYIKDLNAVVAAVAGVQ